MWFEYDFTYGNLRYRINIDGETVAVIGYHSLNSELIIPSSVEYSGKRYRVVRIGRNAFRECSGLTSVEIAKSVTIIGDFAFEGCRGLTTVEIPASVTEIGTAAFKGCSGLTSVKIPASVTEIGWSAFEGCRGLTTVEIPKFVTEIGERAFSDCSGLVSVEIPELVTEIGKYAFACCSGLRSVKIPESVTKIGKHAFSGCSGLVSVKIPGSVTRIGDYSFEYCSGLTSVEIPASVTEIGYYALFCCSGLTRIEVAPGNPVYDSRNGCNAIIETSTNVLIAGCKNTVIPDFITEIYSRAFWGCSGLTSVEIPASVTKIGGSAFSDCSGLTSVKIPASVTKIGGSAFFGCSGLTRIAVEPGNLFYDSRNGCNAIIETFTNTLMAGCKNTLIPASVTEIGKDAFYDCSGLTSIEIPGSVTQIGDSAFSGCSGLTSIKIPASVIKICGWAFLGCSGLTRIDVESGNPVYDSRNGCNAIIETSTNTLIVGCKNTIIHSSVTKIDRYAFRGCGGLSRIDVESGNPVYDSRNGCNAIIETSTNTLVVGCNNTIIPSSVTEIGCFAFSCCSGLKSVKIPESVTEIGESAFRGCSGMTTVEIPASVTKIGMYAFEGCSGLMSVEIPESVTIIGGGAFYGCSGLTSVKIPESVTEIGESAFSGCSGLSLLRIGNTIDRIGKYSFDKCGRLSTIIILPSASNGVKINISAFENLKKYAYPEGIENPSDKGIGIAYPKDGIIDDNGCIYDREMKELYFVPAHLSNLVILKSVCKIHKNAFACCEEMESIVFRRTKIIGIEELDCLKLKRIVVPESESIEIEPDVVINYPKNGAITREGFVYDDEQSKLFYAPSEITNVILPRTVTTIGNHAFYHCEKLESLSLPKSLVKIGFQALSYCRNLKSITCNAVEPPICLIDAFDNFEKSDCILNVPMQSKNGYEMAEEWDGFKVMPIS